MSVYVCEKTWEYLDHRIVSIDFQGEWGVYKNNE
jgi:hypothetical protein